MIFVAKEYRRLYRRKAPANHETYGRHILPKSQETWEGDRYT